MNVQISNLSKTVANIESLEKELANCKDQKSYESLSKRLEESKGLLVDDVNDFLGSAVNPRNYQMLAASTAIYRKNLNHFQTRCKVYATLGLTGEAGEVAEKVKKMMRDNIPVDLVRADLIGELGDVLWYLTMVASEFDIELEDIMDANIEKLKSRKERGVLGGSGDNR